MSLIGAGTVILACIWIFVAISILITAYFRGPLIFVTIGIIAIAVIVTVILLVIPRSTVSVSPDVIYDWMFIYRLILIILLPLFLIAAIIFYYIADAAEVIRPQRLKTD